MLGLSFFGTGHSRAALLLVDDFNDLPAGSIATAPGWDSWNDYHTIVATAPGSASDHVLESTHVQAFSKKLLPASIGESGNTVGTLYFQVYTTGETTGLSVGLMPYAGGSFNAYHAQMTFNNGLSVYNGSAPSAVTNISFESDTWYDIWMVVNNATNTWSAWIQGGAIETATRLTIGAVQTFNFRTTTDIALDAVLIARGGGGGENLGYIDNVYFGLGDLHGELPPQAIPEPSAFGLMGVALAFGWVARMRAARRRNRQTMREAEENDRSGR